MDYGRVSNLMGQQIRAIKDLEELIEHDEKAAVTSPVAPEEIKTLKDYIVNMKRACNAAIDLAKFYEDIEKKTEKTADAENPKESAPKKKKEAKPPKVEPQVETEEIEFDFLE